MQNWEKSQIPNISYLETEINVLPLEKNVMSQKVNINTEQVDEISLLANVFFLICGCLFCPCWGFGICFLTNPSHSVRFLAKVNLCLFLTPLLILIATIIIFVPIAIILFLFSLTEGSLEESYSYY